MDRFIKIGEDGERLSADAAKWLAVFDSKQNLMFSVEETERLTHKKALQHVEALELCGFKDWRLPTVEELFLLADRTRVEPAIDTAFFPNCKSEWYWTATLWAPSPGDYAWFVSFYGGSSGWSGRAGGYHVRAVRAGQ